VPTLFRTAALRRRPLHPAGAHDAVAVPRAVAPVIIKARDTDRQGPLRRVLPVNAALGDLDFAQSMRFSSIDFGENLDMSASPGGEPMSPATC
jgi:hypothetical protein